MFVVSQRRDASWNVPDNIPIQCRIVEGTAGCVVNENNLTSSYLLFRHRSFRSTTDQCVPVRTLRGL